MFWFGLAFFSSQNKGFTVKLLVSLLLYREESFSVE